MALFGKTQGKIPVSVISPPPLGDNLWNDLTSVKTKSWVTSILVLCENSTFLFLPGSPILQTLIQKYATCSFPVTPLYIIFTIFYIMIKAIMLELSNAYVTSLYIHQDTFIKEIEWQVIQLFKNILDTVKDKMLILLFWAQLSLSNPLACNQKYPPPMCYMHMRWHVELLPKKEVEKLSRVVSGVRIFRLLPFSWTLIIS